MTNPPVKKIAVGNIRVNLWENKRITEEGEEVSFQSVSLERTYKDKDNKWQSTTSFKLSDIPKIRLALDELYKQVFLKEI